MPLRFSSKEEYIQKLTEQLFREAECGRITNEWIAEKNIRFEFVEQYPLCCKLRLKIPKRVQQFVKENSILSVTFLNNSTQTDYVGTGIIKSITIKERDAYYYALLQIDIMYPLDKK